MNDDVSKKITKRVRAILSISSRSRRSQVAETFISTRYPLYSRIAVKAIRSSKSTYGFSSSHFESEDISQLIALDEYHLLSEGMSSSAPVLDWVDKWQRVIVVRGSRIARQHLRSSGHTGLADSESAMRRLQELQKTRAILARQGVNVDDLRDSDVVEETNRRLGDANPNYREQGMHCVLEDTYLSSISVYSPSTGTDETVEISESASPAFSAPAPAPDDSLLGVTGAGRLVADILARAKSLSTLHGKVAAEWIGEALPDGLIRSPKEIADRIDLDLYLVEKMLSDVRGEAVISASLTAGISAYEFLGLKDASRRRQYA